MIATRTSLAVAALVAVAIPAATAAGAASTRNAAKIASAMSAAPASVARHATIKDYPQTPNGPLPVLRAGSNGWTCLPDDPSTPGPDPICFDKQSASWFDAWLAHAGPQLSSDGYSYMLAGSSDASDTDPFATRPAAGMHWMTAAPHVMVFPKNPTSLNHYTADRSNGGPWVMFRGTPYAHLMFPVQTAH